MNCTAYTYYIKLMAECKRGVDELYSIYLLCHANGQMYVCLIASSIKSIIKRLVAMYHSSQPAWDGLMSRLICVFLGYDLPIQLLLK